jgi:predicted dehydrogenase
MSGTGEPLGVGVIGLGFIGQTHLRALARAQAEGLRCRVESLCDADPARLAGAPVRGNIETGSAGADLHPGAARVADPGALLHDPRVHAVIICTHTDTHVPMALRALAAGKHVLVEKPVAVSSAEVRRLRDAAGSRPDLVCMPAMCIRFWPAWAWLKERIVDGALGRVRSAVFLRLAPVPRWGGGFYEDLPRSGGALIDLHIHDADMVLWCLGEPDEVAATGSALHVTTLYRYRDGPAHVVAEGGWSPHATEPFRMAYRVVFEGGTAEYEHGREPELVLHRESGSEGVSLRGGTGYDHEVRAFVGACMRGAPRRSPVSMDDAVRAAELLERERRALGGV